ncbi:MAG: hypothetical protein GF341_03950, partial [candidate division Zixibacteria bacterium]|nr:hypothetical protein [candidate division Zixibacteria bacterium]
NGDHLLDVAVSLFGDESVAVLANSGDGTLTAPVFYETDSGPRSLIARDLDGNATADLVAGNFGTITVSFLFNCGTPLTCNCLHQADLDESGSLDAVDMNSVIEVLFFNGLDPQDPGCPTTRADYNDDAVVDATDLNHLINHLFFNGPEPCDPCSQSSSVCGQ